MDEFNSGMEPEVRLYLRRILSTLGAILLWIMTFVTAGIYFGLAIPEGHLQWYNGVFYACFLIGTFLFVRYLHRLWKRKES